MPRRLYRRAPFSAAAALALVPVLAAHATGVTGGTWQASLTLPWFPCVGTPCNGSFTGTVAGTMVGVDDTGTPFVVTWPDPTATPVLPSNLSATFNYTEDCPVGAVGSATGIYTLTGGYVERNGTFTHDGTLTGAFGEARVGVLVVVTTGSGVLTGAGMTLSRQQNLGAGGGGFAPTTVTVATCTSVQPMSAKIVGSFGNPP